MTQNHQLQRQRFELKYLLREELTSSVRDFLRCHLVLDEFSANRSNYSYPVHSVYLDTDDLKTHQATQNGNKNRFKLRLRYYDDAPESPVFFEIKGRVDNCILKQRCPVSRELVPMVLAGQLPASNQVAAESPRHYGSLQRFHELMLRLNAQPRAHNNYLREAWVSPHNNSVRITFDRNIRIEPFFGRHAVVSMTNPVPIYSRDVVFEIKFTERFPNWLREMVSHFGLRQFSAAKYSGGVALLGEHRFQRGSHSDKPKLHGAPPRHGEIFVAANLPAFAEDFL